jgi:hypothetical protein
MSIIIIIIIIIIIKCNDEVSEVSTYNYCTRV